MPAHRFLPLQPAWGRRAVLALAVGGGLAGCSDTPARPAGVAPDVRLASGLVRRLGQSLALTGSSSRYAGLTRVQQAHLAMLARAVPPAVRRSARAPRPARQATVAKVRADTADLYAALVDGAVSAQSGAFASLLGSMAAGVAQQAEELGWTEVAPAPKSAS